jgi:hypothetical protein
LALEILICFSQVTWPRSSRFRVSIFTIFLPSLEMDLISAKQHTRPAFVLSPKNPKPVMAVPAVAMPVIAEQTVAAGNSFTAWPKKMATA